jgi:CelD/BcsL family acetyltransferase involved in cellulose biosynthesis
MHFEIIRDTEAFMALESIWKTIHTASNQATIFLGWEWMSTWTLVYTDEIDRLLTVVVYNGKGRPIGIAPLYIKRCGEGSSGRELRFLGTGEPEEEEVCTEYLDVLIDQEEVETGIEGIARAIRDTAHEWDFATLDYLLYDSLVLTRLLKMGYMGRHVQISVSGYRHCINLPTDWNEYLTGLSKSMRNQIRQKRRRFEQSSGARCTQVSHASQIPKIIETMARLNKSRWTAKGKRGVFEAHRFRQFHENIMHKTLESRQLRLRVLEVENRVIGIIYNFYFKGIEYYYQSGIDDNGAKRLSPGVVGHSIAIEQLISNGDSAYDFMQGKQNSYKNTYGTRLTPMYTAVTVSWTCKGTWLILLFTMSQTVKLLRQCMQRVKRSVIGEQTRACS